ncbi:hypothetical protein HDU82_003710, partial [Entophlyctis luteolus]
LRPPLPPPPPLLLSSVTASWSLQPAQPVSPHVKQETAPALPSTFHSRRTSRQVRPRAPNRLLYRRPGLSAAKGQNLLLLPMLALNDILENLVRRRMPHPGWPAKKQIRTVLFQRGFTLWIRFWIVGQTRQPENLNTTSNGWDIHVRKIRGSLHHRST